MKRTLLTMALAAVLPFATNAQEESPSFAVEGLKLSIGPSYRNFRQVHFNNARTPAYQGFLDKQGNLHDYAGIKAYVDSQLGTAGTRAALDPLAVTVVKYDGGASRSHSGYGHEESIGFNLGLSANLWQDETLSLDAVTNFQYFSISSGAKGAFNGSSSAYTEYYFTGSVPAPDTDPSDIIYNLRGSYRSRFDLDLFVFDAGLSLGYTACDNLTLYLAGGPTLSIADMESSSFAAVGDGNTKLAARRDRKNEIEFEWGLYAALGAAYQFDETFGLAAEFRYDEAFGTVGTRIAKQDLDGWGGMIKLLVSF